MEFIVEKCIKQCTWNQYEDMNVGQAKIKVIGVAAQETTW